MTHNSNIQSSACIFIKFVVHISFFGDGNGDEGGGSDGGGGGGCC